MPQTRLAERARFARALIAAGREIHQHVVARGPGDHFGREVDLVLLTLAVIIGESEGRPLNETKLSLFTDMPRATVQRKLNLLVERGVVVREKRGVRVGKKALYSTTHVDRVKRLLHDV